jgi:hypothetical protein
MLARNQEAELRRHNPAFGIMKQAVHDVIIGFGGHAYESRAELTRVVERSPDVTIW